MTDTTWVVAAGAAFFVLVAMIARPRQREAVVTQRPLRRFEEHLEPLPGEFDTAAGAAERATFLRDKGFIAIARVAASATAARPQYEVVVAKHERAAVDALLDPPPTTAELEAMAAEEGANDDLEDSEDDDDEEDEDDRDAEDDADEDDQRSDRLLSFRTIDAVYQRLTDWRTWLLVALGIAGLGLLERWFR